MNQPTNNPVAPPSTRPPSPILALCRLLNDPQARAGLGQGAPQFFVAHALNRSGIRVLPNPLPTLQAILIQMAGANVVLPHQKPRAGDVWVEAEGAVVGRIGFVAKVSLEDWFVALDGESAEPYRRTTEGVAYWLRFG